GALLHLDGVAEQAARAIRLLAVDAIALHAGTAGLAAGAAAIGLLALSLTLALLLSGLLAGLVALPALTLLLALTGLLAGALALLLSLTLLALTLLLALLLALTVLALLTLLSALALLLLRLAAAGAHLLFEALAQLALLVGELLAFLGVALALCFLGLVVEVALIVHRAVGVLHRGVHGPVPRTVRRLRGAAATAHLQLHVLHLVEHLLHVVQKLPRLIARAGLGEIAQGLKHAVEFVVAERLRAAGAALLLVALRDA